MTVDPRRCPKGRLASGEAIKISTLVPAAPPAVATMAAIMRTKAVVKLERTGRDQENIAEVCIEVAAAAAAAPALPAMSYVILSVRWEGHHD